MNYTLISGASRGIGRALAFECGSRMMNMILVARSLEDLVSLKNDILSKYSVDIHCIQLDLKDDKAGEFLKEYIESNGINLNLLINNAGFGLYGEFYNSSLENNLKLIKLNISSVVNVTHALIPLLQNQDSSNILNVSSTIAFQPTPMFSVYSASKSFVYFFSRGLRKELKEYGIGVTCLMPGPTKTNFFNNAGMQENTGLLKMMQLTPEEVAEKALKGMFKNRVKVIPGFLNKFQYLLFSFTPTWLSSAMASKAMKNQGK